MDALVSFALWYEWKAAQFMNRVEFPNVFPHGWEGKAMERQGVWFGHSVWNESPTETIYLKLGSTGH